MLQECGFEIGTEGIGKGFYKQKGLYEERRGPSGKETQMVPP